MTFGLLVILGFAYVASELTLRPERRSRPERLSSDALRSRNLLCHRWSSRENMPMLICESWAADPVKPASSAPPYRGTLLLLHGHKGCKEDMLGLAERFCAEGWRCVIPDLPAHGQNPLRDATFGFTECDLLERMWRQAIAEHADWLVQPLTVFGYSQGGAIALQLAARQQMPIQAVVSVSAFDDLRQPIRASAGRWAGQWPQVVTVLSTICEWGIRCRAGFWPSETAPISVVERIRVPTLLIHGEEDHFVPCVAAKRLSSRMKNCHVETEVIARAGHFDAIKVGGRRLSQKMMHFLRSAADQSKS